MSVKVRNITEFKSVSVNVKNNTAKFKSVSVNVKNNTEFKRVSV